MWQALINPIASLIDKLIPDKKAADEAKLKLLELQQNGELEKMSVLGEVIISETQSESWISRNWRAITMLSFVAIVINNYIIAEYLKAFGLNYVILDIPPKMWSLLEIGLGGYLLGSTAERIVPMLKKTNQGSS